MLSVVVQLWKKQCCPDGFTAAASKLGFLNVSDREDPNATWGVQCNRDLPKESERSVDLPVEVTSSVHAPIFPVFASLQEFGGAVKENISSRLYSVSTRAGTSRRSFGDSERRDFGYDSEAEDEARGLLGEFDEETEAAVDDGQAQDIEAMDALLKLRPAAFDSVGDQADEDSEDVSARPLVGTDRRGALRR
jgi:hypothetical protein